MSACERCSLEDKILQCCGTFPVTGGKKTIMTSRRRPVGACPYLSPLGMCGIYESRPQACREFFCDSFGRLAQNQY
jgi:Fe-S-cluster containining protein